MLVRLSAGADVTMVWDPSPSTNVAAYRVYYGTASRAYGAYVQVAAPMTTAVIGNLLAGATYYFAATAADAAGNESIFSNEATFLPPLTNIPPTAVALAVTTAEDTPANVTLRGTSGSGNPLVFSVATVPANGTLTGAAPNLLYTPRTNFFGTDQFTYTVSDGTGTASALVSINVAPVNDPPTIDAPAGIIIAQNAGPQVVALTGISSGALNEAQSLVVTAKTSSPWIAPDPIVNYVSPSSTGTLTFTPKTNAIGWVTFTITVSDSGTSNNITTKTFWVLVNNPPTIDPIPDIVVNEDSGTQTINFTGVTPGAPNETNQVITVGVVTTNPGLIPKPALNYTNPSTTGSMIFTPAPNGFGSSVITLIAMDGQYGNNVVRRTFRITVNPVNDPPTLNPIASVSMDATGGPKTISLSGISAGPTNENQNVVITATSSNPTLVAPTISYANPNSTGTLTLTPVSGQTGSATISVKASDGLASVTQSFTVNVTSLPKISGLTAAAADARTLNVAWTTDKTATGVVEYGTTPNVDMMSAQTFGTTHSVTLTNLQPGTLYYLNIKATAGGTATAIATAATEPVQVVPVAAESGIFAGSFKTYSSAAAQNGKYIAASSINNATATYALNLPRGLNYQIWARLKAPITGATFGVIMDGVEKPIFAADNGAAGQWHWALLTDNLNPIAGAVWPLEAGSHQFVARGATGLWLDEFVLVNDPTWQPILPNVGPTLTALRTSSATATLTWTDPAENATIYGIEYSQDGINFFPSASATAPATSLSVGNVGAQTYYFRVYSSNSVDRSAYSNVAVF